MARFFFNVVKASGTLKDLEGTEVSSLEHARHEAITDARNLMSMAILEGRDISNQRIEIVNEGGVLLLIVPFREAIEHDG